MLFENQNHTILVAVCTVLQKESGALAGECNWLCSALLPFTLSQQVHSQLKRQPRLRQARESEETKGGRLQRAQC